MREKNGHAQDAKLKRGGGGGGGGGGERKWRKLSEKGTDGGNAPSKERETIAESENRKAADEEEVVCLGEKKPLEI